MAEINSLEHVNNLNPQADFRLSLKDIQDLESALKEKEQLAKKSARNII